jgi:hypothetical protein
MNPQPKPTRWKSKKYRDAAKGQPCTMRLPCCNNDPATTVLAHANGGGMGTKSDDFNAADCCSDCHDILDRRKFLPEYDEGVLRRIFISARYETIANRIKRGILK